MKEDKNDLTIFDDGDFGMFNPFFNDVFRFPKLTTMERNFQNIMKTDIKETEKGYSFEIEVPGYNKEDINLDLKDGYLNISVQKNFEKDEKDKKGNYVRRERHFGHTSRSYFVGKDIKEEDIKAKLDNGILNIEVPKSNPKQIEHKKIEIL